MEITSFSVFIKDQIDEYSIEEEIPLPNVKIAILQKIIDFCLYIKDNALHEIETTEIKQL